MKFKQFINDKIPRILRPLAGEAKKYTTFEEFEKAFLSDIKHGRYYHITDDPNFTIDLGKGPRDMSSLAMNHDPDKGKLMITSDLENWLSSYGERKYVAIIDMKDVPKESYKQVKRGFGNEFIVFDPSKAKVLKVVSRSTAASDSRRYQKALESNIKSSDDLKEFYNKVRDNKNGNY
jgi:hypothetical protein